MMNRFLKTVLIGLFGITCFNSTKVHAESSFIETESYDDLTKISWHNNAANLINDDQTLSLFNKYDVDLNEAINSLDVYIQEQYFEFDELYTNDLNENSIETAYISATQTQEYLHNKGYIKFITKAYALGFYDGSIVYHIVVTTEQKKSFMINQNDNLIIRHGDNAVTLNIDNYQTKGKSYTPCTIYWAYDPNNPTIADVHKELSSNYSCSTGGVYYTFPVGYSSTMTDVATTVYGNTQVTGDYYMVATDTTEVQPVYVHNRNLVIDSLSLSFGPIGVGVSTGKLADVMEGTSMTLKGYNSRIEHSTYEINQIDWNFDQRYYFENEGIKSSTVYKDDLIIKSNRLRCGYIENEFINLSPNRYNAGEAYFEMRFNLPIYEYSVNLSYWSSNEYLNESEGDYAYIQYLDSSSNWVNYINLLNINLSTTRSNTKEVTCDFIEGTYAIRIIAHKENPNTNRNKGRICIGNMKFITYKIN